MAVVKITMLFVCLVVGGIVIGTIGARLKRAGGGREIKIDDAPYFVSLKRNGHLQCGGAFISNQHVLTAAHCVLDVSTELLPPLFNTVVVIATDVPDGPNVKHSILNISAHPDFRENRCACNIAVITLSVPVVWNEKQHAIGLPNAEPRCKMLATFVGFQILPISKVGLRELTVNICPIDPILYGRTGRHQSISDVNLGGALVYEGRIVGIASKRRKPSYHFCYFVNVLKFKTFIEQSMGMVPSPTGISWVPSVVDFDDIEWE